MLMSTFYDDIKPHTDVVFVCNNHKTIREISKQFPLVENWWFYPKPMFSSRMYFDGFWEELTNDKFCLGTGVTPKNFDYIKDWIECGKWGVFDYYGVKRYPAWGAPYACSESWLVIQPFGGADDQTKIKEIPKDKLMEIIGTFYEKNYKIFLIGSNSDKEKLGEIENTTWITDINKSFMMIKKCSLYVGADSWGKTLAAFAGKEVWIYPNKYLKPVEEMFGHEKDPGNYVFLDNWGFRFYDGKE